MWTQGCPAAGDRVHHEYKEKGRRVPRNRSQTLRTQLFPLSALPLQSGESRIPPTPSAFQYSFDQISLNL